MSTQVFGVFFALILAAPAHSLAFGQTNQAASTTSLTTNSASLVLPGSLTLTSAVNQPAVAGGMPTGSVNFFYDGTHSLGIAPLKFLPGSQSFLSPQVTQAFGNNPFGFFTLNFGTSTYSAAGALDFFQVPASNPSAQPYYVPEVTVFSGQGSGLFKKMAAFQINDPNFQYSSQYDNPTTAFSFATADFNHDGYPDVLIHGPSSSDSGGLYFYVLPGTSAGGFNPADGVLSPDTSSSNCDCNQPTSEMIAIDDFNGDGYPDVAYVENNGIVGVALNIGPAATGATPAGSFTTFKNFTGLPQGFQPTYVASGHFTSSGHADLVITGQPVGDATAGSIVTLLGQGDGTFVLGTLTPFTLTYSPSAVATADFNQDGKTDVVVANQSGGTVEVIFGNGMGGLEAAQANNIFAVGPSPSALAIADFNNDGYPDILTTDSSDGAFWLLLNDGTGHFGKAVKIATAPNGPVTPAIGDFNGDGLPDVAGLAALANVYATTAYVVEETNSASAQAVLATASQTLPSGSHTLTAMFPGDNNFSASTSTGVPVTVTQTPSVLSWAPPAAIEYGVPLGMMQLNAMSSVSGMTVYTPGTGAMLPPGTNTLNAVFTPTDSFDYSGATASQSITVMPPVLSSVQPTSAKLGDPQTTITLTGQGFVNGAVAEWNGSQQLATTYVSLNQLTAILPASLFNTAGTGTITVIDPNSVTVGGSQTFTVIAPAPTAQASAPATAEATQGASVTLTVNPYPAPITATLTLAFTPASPITVSDPAVMFQNDGTTLTIDIPANSAAAIPSVAFETGSTAGTITITIHLSAGGVDITPATLTPIAVSVPAGPPVLNTASLTRSGMTMQVVINGFSSTRDMTQAVFEFTAAPGQTLKTTTLTVPLATAFTSWYDSADSDTFGTTFVYTQPFTLDSNATDVGSVTVTLTNSQGTSQSKTAQ